MTANVNVNTEKAYVELDYDIIKTEQIYSVIKEAGSGMENPLKNRLMRKKQRKYSILKQDFLFVLQVKFPDGSEYSSGKTPGNAVFDGKNGCCIQLVSRDHWRVFGFQVFKRGFGIVVKSQKAQTWIRLFLWEWVLLILSCIFWLFSAVRQTAFYFRRFVF